MPLTEAHHSPKPLSDAGKIDARLYQAHLTVEDFQRARLVSPALGAFESYDEWLDEREGSSIGLSHAGIEVVSVRMIFARFVEWAQLNRIEMGVNTLDEFAERIERFRDARPSIFVAELSEVDFNKFGSRIEATEPFVNYEEWSRYRRQKYDCAAGEVNRVAIGAAAFAQWARCLALPTSESNLDAYARLLLEYFAEPD